MLAGVLMWLRLSCWATTRDHRHPHGYFLVAGVPITGIIVLVDEIAEIGAGLPKR
jgi:hypothetical protein